MKILITGGRGFVGKNLIKLINKRYELYILSSNMKYEFCENYLIGDLKNYPSFKNYLKEIEVVIHLAFSKKYSENIVMVENLINACNENCVKRLILVSSMAAKRKHPDEYGKIKMQVEKLIKNSGLNYIILRPSIIYGPGSTSFNFIIEKIEKIPFFLPIIGNGKYKISPIHVDDVGKFIEIVLKNRDLGNREYDLPGGEEIEFISLIDALKSELKLKRINVGIPLFICNFIAMLFPFLISRQNIKNISENSNAEIHSARKDLNYNPIKFSEGVKNGLL